MQVFCERFLRFLAGEDPDSVVCDCSRSGPGVADEVRNPDTPIAVPEQVQTRSLRDYRLQPLYPFQMPDLILRQAPRPAANRVKRRLRNWTENVPQLRES